ncbi:MAG: hypothetical protein U5R30_19740 [Deltaproteobacteria bacterium]|nr:hypothetical protein [Deltaproteobacteria bacterium]
MKPELHADLRITRGDDVITVYGRGDVIEVHSWSNFFFFKHLRKNSPLKFSHYVAFDSFARRTGISIVLNLHYFKLTVLGARSKRWVRAVARIVLPK